MCCFADSEHNPRFGLGTRMAKCVLGMLDESSIGVWNISYSSHFPSLYCEVAIRGGAIKHSITFCDRDSEDAGLFSNVSSGSWMAFMPRIIPRTLHFRSKPPSSADPLKVVWIERCIPVFWHSSDLWQTPKHLPPI